jgi:hypothetical protein
LGLDIGPSDRNGKQGCDENTEKQQENGLDGVLLHDFFSLGNVL